MSKVNLGNEFKTSDINVNMLLLATYSHPCYSGTAFVLYEYNGKLWEVNASHCSCYGLEEQWDPEETTLDAIRHRLDNGKIIDKQTDKTLRKKLQNIKRYMDSLV